MNYYAFGKFRRGAGPGFTAIEIIIVMVVVAIMAVMATVAIGSVITSYRLNAATAKVLADIRYAQQQARVKNGWYGVGFQVNPTNKYNVYYTDGASDVDVLDPSNPAQVLDVDLSGEFDGVQITGVVIGSATKVEFNPIGTPYEDMNDVSALASDGTLTLSLGSAARTIKIFKNTGRAELQ